MRAAAVSLFTEEGTAADLAASGLTLEEATAAATVEVWPDCWDACMLFVDAMSQWRVGFSGPTGLDYSAVLALMDLRSLGNRAALFDDIRVMEAAVLHKMRTNK